MTFTEFRQQLLIEQFAQPVPEWHPSREQITAAEQRIDLTEHRALIRDLADDERRKTAEKAAKEKARADIERLEQQLAAARAVLRGKTPAPLTSGTKTCKDCGGPVVREPGQPGRIPSRCNDCKAKA